MLTFAIYIQLILSVFKSFPGICTFHVEETLNTFRSFNCSNFKFTAQLCHTVIPSVVGVRLTVISFNTKNMEFSNLELKAFTQNSRFDCQTMTVLPNGKIQNFILVFKGLQ